MEQAQPLKINIGCGRFALDGFTPVDRENGQEGYPLDFDDDSIEEIYASHVLEHFSHREVSTVVNHWVQKLKPGGRIRIAVPDFEWIAKRYLDKRPINVQGYLMGCHKNGDDHHGTVFDQESLSEVMAGAGLERIERWSSDLTDGASLECSLNLSGHKPLTSDGAVTGVVAVLSAPRFGPVMHMRCAFSAFNRTNVPYQISQGAFWHQVISECLEEQITEGVEYLLTCDYDTVFRAQDVRDLFRLMKAFPNADAICALQSKRSAENALFGMRDAEGNPVTAVHAQEFDRHLTRIHSGHFGLTIFRAAKLDALPRPWMLPTPNNAGRWTDGKVDADMVFWRNWDKAEHTLYLANRVVVGHLEELIAWPKADFSPIHQTVSDYTRDGLPPEAAR